MKPVPGNKVTNNKSFAVEIAAEGDSDANSKHNSIWDRLSNMKSIWELKQIILKSNICTATGNCAALYFPLIFSLGDGGTLGIVQVERRGIDARYDTFVENDGGSAGRACDRSLSRLDFAGLGVGTLKFLIKFFVPKQKKNLPRVQQSGHEQIPAPSQKWEHPPLPS